MYIHLPKTGYAAYYLPKTGHPFDEDTALVCMFVSRVCMGVDEHFSNIIFE
jgi:hypothetical protein